MKPDNDDATTGSLLLLVPKDPAQHFQTLVESYREKLEAKCNRALEQKKLAGSVTIGKLVQRDAIGKTRSVLTLELSADAPPEVHTLFRAGNAATCDGIDLTLTTIADWRESVAAIVRKGDPTTVVLSGIPFVLTEAYAESLLPYLKRYGENDSYKLNSSRSAEDKLDGSITFRFYLSGTALPTSRPVIPLVYHRQFLGQLQPSLGQVRVMGHKNCKVCPAIDGTCADADACKMKIDSLNERKKRSIRASAEATMRDKAAHAAAGTVAPPKVWQGRPTASFGHKASAAEIDAAKAAAPEGKEVCMNYMTQHPRGCKRGDACRHFHWDGRVDDRGHLGRRARRVHDDDDDY